MQEYNVSCHRAFYNLLELRLNQLTSAVSCLLEPGSIMTTSSSTDLLFTITPGEGTWTILGPTLESLPHLVPNPLADVGFLEQVSELRRYSSVKIPPGDQGSIRLYEDVARELSIRITPLLLSDEARQAVLIRLNQVQLGRARLTIRVADQGPLSDQVLKLPWEVLAPDSNEFPVRQSVLEVVRESVVPGAPELPEPSGPFGVAVAIAAPEGQATLSYEKEEVRLQTVLAALGHAVAFSDLGTLDDLVELVDQHRATAILFSGHGLPGQLLFENRLGFAEPIAAEEVVRRLRTVLLSPGRGGSFPGVFFLSSCEGATSEDGPSAAAALHRAGFPQVIGYFGPVRDSAASRAEEMFFRCLARGDTALQAAHRARASLVDVIEHEGEPFVYPLAWTQIAIYHRGADRPVGAGGRTPGRSLPARFRRRTEARHGVPVLSQGFIGRRALQHEILRKVSTGERLVVLQGLGGSGKTALAGHLMTRRLALSPHPAGALLLRAPSLEDEAEPILALRRQAEEHGRRHALPGWEERLAELRERFPAPAAGFAATLRALQAALSQSPFAVYVDRVDALQEGPGADGGPGTWRAGAAEWWRELEELAAEDFLVLASTRYAGADLPGRSHLGVPPLSSSDAFRMMAFFVELADLTPEERRRLAEWTEGHPLAIALLDAAVDRRYKSQGLGYEPADRWKELVEPVLPEVGEAVRREIRLDELWAGLPEAAREQARRITATGKRLALAEVDQLGGERDLLIRAGLLVRHLKQETFGGVRWVERWGVPRLIAELIADDSSRG
jgi:CHAT domain